MRFNIFNKPNLSELAELKERVDQGDAVERMMKTDGWKLLGPLLHEQLEAYRVDNATAAKDWEDYMAKRGKIFGIELLLTDIEDYIRLGKEASEELDKLNNP